MKEKVLYSLLDRRDDLLNQMDLVLETPMVCIRTYKKLYLKLSICEALISKYYRKVS
jgi:hypothetical protein